MSTAKKAFRAAQNLAANPADTSQEYFTIGTLAQMCGVTVRTLRYYEEMDLIGPVKRTDSQYRLYNHHSLKRVKAVLALQDLNYSLEEILVTLGAYSKTRDFNKAEQIEATKRSLDLQKSYIDKRFEQLTQMKAEIDDRLATLETVCHPCLDQASTHTCREDCAYINVHD